MGGLLYKDFVASCRIKKINLVWIMIGVTALFIALRVCFAGTAVNEEFLVQTDKEGEKVNILDVCFLMMMSGFIIFCMSIINSFVGKITESDERNKVNIYMRAMPIGRYDYVASKYIFIAILCYVLLSLEMLWGVVCEAYCLEGQIRDFCQIITSFCIPLISASMVFAAIELPLFLRFGREKAMYGKVAIMTVIALLVVCYVLFGDLSIFDRINLVTIMKWVNAHKTILMIINLISPILVLAFYYGSFKVACKLMDGKES